MSHKWFLQMSSAPLDLSVALHRVFSVGQWPRCIPQSDGNEICTEDRNFPLRTTPKCIEHGTGVGNLSGNLWESASSSFHQVTSCYIHLADAKTSSALSNHPKTISWQTDGGKPLETHLKWLLFHIQLDSRCPQPSKAAMCLARNRNRSLQRLATDASWTCFEQLEAIHWLPRKGKKATLIKRWRGLTLLETLLFGSNIISPSITIPNPPSLFPSIYSFGVNLYLLIHPKT